MDPVKIAGVAEWLTPGSKKEVQSFLGFTNFYHHFIQGFSDLAWPLFDLTQNNSDWYWEAAEQSAFKAICKRVVSTPILMFPDDSRPFWVEVDSSDFATGAVLSQQSPLDNMWHLVAYYSKSLNAVERNYEIHDKEMLAIIRALEDWRHFLEGAHHQFEIWTDHKNLEYFMSAKKLNRHQARWSPYLSRFNFDMHYRPGCSMGKFDALSRRADHGTGGGDNDNITLLHPEFFAAHVVRALFGLSPEGEERDILRDIRNANHAGKQENAVVQMAGDLRESKEKSVRASEWLECDGLLCFRDRIYVPNHPELHCCIALQHHDTKVAGHPGCWKTLELISRSYWWPQTSRYIGQYTRTCDICLQMKIQQHCPTRELHPLPIL
jgi:hypothetical protein